MTARNRPYILARINGEVNVSDIRMNRVRL